MFLYAGWYIEPNRIGTKVLSRILFAVGIACIPTVTEAEHKPDIVLTAEM